MKYSYIHFILFSSFPPSSLPRPRCEGEQYRQPGVWHVDSEAHHPAVPQPVDGAPSHHPLRTQRHRQILPGRQAGRVHHFPDGAGGDGAQRGQLQCGPEFQQGKRTDSKWQFRIVGVFWQRFFFAVFADTQCLTYSTYASVMWVMFSLCVHADILFLNAKQNKNATPGCMCVQMDLSLYDYRMFVLNCSSSCFNSDRLSDSTSWHCPLMFLIILQHKDLNNGLQNVTCITSCL